MEGFVLDQNILAAWSLSFSELEFVHGYRHAMRIGIAVQLLHFRSHGTFPHRWVKYLQDAVEYVADQVGECVVPIPIYDSASDTSRRHRLDILRFLGSDAQQIVTVKQYGPSLNYKLRTQAQLLKV